MSHEFTEHLENQAQFITSLCMIHPLQTVWKNRKIGLSLKGTPCFASHIWTTSIPMGRSAPPLYLAVNHSPTHALQNIRPHMKWEMGQKPYLLLLREFGMTSLGTETEHWETQI